MAINDLYLRPDAGDGPNSVRLRPDGADAALYLGRPLTIVNVRRAVNARPVESELNLLLTLLAAAAVTAPFVQQADQWVRPQFTPSRYPDAVQNLLLTLLPTTLAPFINEAEAKPVELAKRQHEATQNLLLTLLAAPAVALPFVPTEWAQPVSRAVRVAETSPNLRLTLLPTTLAPFQSSDWTRATGRVWRQYQAESNLFFSTLGPKPFVNESWPAPPRLSGRVAEATQNLLVTTLAGAAASAPFIPAEWGRPAPLLTRSVEAVQNLLGTLLPTTLPPFVPKDWLVFKQVPGRVAEATSNLLTSTLGLVQQPMPFIPVEWTANQKPVTRVSEPQTNRLLDLFPVTQRPLNQVNWPRALGAVSTDRAREAVPNLTILIAPQPKPFVAFDWLQPRVSRFRPLIYSDPNLVLLYITDVFGGLSGTDLLEAFARVSELDAQVLTAQLSTAARTGNLEAMALMARLDAAAVMMKLEAVKDNPELSA